MKVCSTSAPSAVALPSPKSQVTVSGSPSASVEVSWNVTFSGGAPLAGVAVKLATGRALVDCATASASRAISSNTGACSRSAAAASRRTVSIGTSTLTSARSSSVSSAVSFAIAASSRPASVELLALVGVEPGVADALR